MIWRWPLLLAALIVFGLLSALLGQGGIWWGLSWIALATPLLLIVLSIARRRRASA
jgi:hypothetical protein